MRPSQIMLQTKWGALAPGPLPSKVSRPQLQWITRATDEAAASPSAPAKYKSDGRRVTYDGKLTRDGRRSQKGAGPIRRKQLVSKTSEDDTPTDAARPRTKLADLKKGQRVTGVVRTVTAEGVIVNVRAEQDALLHESQLTPAFPLKSWKRGDKVVANIFYVNPSTLKLTLKEGGFREEAYRMALEDVEPGCLYEGKVKKTMQKADAEGWVRDAGAFIDMGLADKVDLWVPTSEGLKDGIEVLVIIDDEFDVAEVKKRRRIVGRRATPEEIKEASEEEEEVEVEVDAEPGRATDKRSLYGDGADKIKKNIQDKYSYLDDM